MYSMFLKDFNSWNNFNSIQNVLTIVFFQLSYWLFIKIKKLLN